MKYVRTKDGIFEVEKKQRAYFEGQPWLYYCKGKSSLVEEKDILKQADTIEELCDGFIGVSDKDWFKKNRVATKGIDYFQKPFELEYGIYKNDFANVKLKNQNGWEYTAIEWQRDRHDFIFGYIETNKGLIYVAKMNDEGELELL